jgi:hypothetical protein
LGGVIRIVRRKQLSHRYDDIISLENLCLAWEEFIIGKKKKRDVIKFGGNLVDHIVELHESLVNHTYHHGVYESFFVNDPKRRHIHKASVRGYRSVSSWYFLNNSGKSACFLIVICREYL